MYADIRRREAANDQYVRDNRDDGAYDLQESEKRRCERGCWKRDRKAAVEYEDVCAGRSDAGGASGSARGVVRGRGRDGERVCGKRGTDGREIPAVSIWEGGRESLPDGRPGAIPEGWRNRVCRKKRSSGEDPRVSDRARRDRGGVAAVRGDQRSGSDGERRSGRREEISGVSGERGRREVKAGGVEGVPEAEVAGVYAAGSVHHIEGVAPHSEWETGPRGAAGACGWRETDRGVRRLPDADRGDSSRDFGGGLETGSSGDLRELLRDRRAFVIGDAGGFASEGRVRSGDRSEERLRGAQGGGTGASDRR